MFDETFSQLVSSAAHQPEADEPTVSVFSLLRVGQQSIHRMEKALGLVLRDLFFLLLAVLPLGPADPSFGPLLHLLLDVSPLQCWLEWRAQDPDSSEHSQAPDLFGRKVSVNIALLDELRALQARKELTAETFARAVVESSPPFLGALLAPLLQFFLDSGGHFHAPPSSSSSSLARLLGKLPIPMPCPSLAPLTDSFSSTGEVGRFYFDKFRSLHRILHPAAALEQLGEEAGEEQKVAPSHFRRSQEMHRELAERIAAVDRDEPAGPQQERPGADGEQALLLFAALCFDPAQRGILPLRLPFQWFAVVALRVSVLLFLVLPVLID